jgi:hypothetical protein
LPYSRHRFPKFFVRDVQVALRLLDVGVAEHQLDRADVGVLAIGVGPDVLAVGAIHDGDVGARVVRERVESVLTAFDLADDVSAGPLALGVPEVRDALVGVVAGVQCLIRGIYQIRTHTRCPKPAPGGRSGRPGPITGSGLDQPVRRIIQPFASRSAA